MTTGRLTRKQVDDAKSLLSSICEERCAALLEKSENQVYAQAALIEVRNSMARFIKDFEARAMDVGVVDVAAIQHSLKSSQDMDEELISLEENLNILSRRLHAARRDIPEQVLSLMRARYNKQRKAIMETEKEEVEEPEESIIDFMGVKAEWEQLGKQQQSVKERLRKVAEKLEEEINMGDKGEERAPTETEIILQEEMAKFACEMHKEEVTATLVSKTRRKSTQRRRSKQGIKGIENQDLTDCTVAKSPTNSTVKGKRSGSLPNSTTKTPSRSQSSSSVLRCLRNLQ